MKVTKDIHELILAYLREDISEEEMSRLRVWLDENERHQRLLEELWDKDVLQREIGEYASFDTSRRWEQLKEVMEKPVRKGRSLLKVWGAVGCRGGGFRGRTDLWQMAGSSQPETETSRCCPDRTGWNTGRADNRDGETRGVTGIERYLFKYNGDGDLEYWRGR